MLAFEYVELHVEATGQLSIGSVNLVEDAVGRQGVDLCSPSKPLGRLFAVGFGWLGQDLFHEPDIRVRLLWRMLGLGFKPS